MKYISNYILLFHFIGQIMTFIVLAISIIKKLWILLFLTPFLIYPFAWRRHYFFEKNKPTALKNPFLAKISDWRMLKNILCGKLKIW